MNLKKAGLVGAVAAALALFGGCHNPVEPIIDNPPAISSFTVSPASIKQGGKTTFSFSASDDKGLDMAILNYGDGNADTLKLAGQTSYSSSKDKIYTASGVKTAELDVFDTAHQKASKTVNVGVDAILPPVFDISSQIKLNAGDVVGYAKRNIAHDPQSLPVTVHPSSIDAHISVTETTDSIKVTGNTGGTYNFTLDASNGTSASSQVENVIVTPYTIIRVHDILENTYISGLNPELVMQGPLSGWVSVVAGKDSSRIAINADGTAKFLTPSKQFRVYRFATNGVDSSFVAFDDFPAGTTSVDGFVETNAGTDNSVAGIVKPIPLHEYQDFLVGTNFGSMNGRVVGVDFSKVNTYYLSGNDLHWASGAVYLHNTSAQQDSLASVLEQWKVLLPPTVRNNVVIYKAPQGDSIPQIMENGSPRPPPQMGWFFAYNGGGAGSFQEYDSFPIIESAIMTYNSNISEPGQTYAKLQESGSWFCAPLADSDVRLANKSIFSEISFTKITNFDKKLFYIVVQHLGAPAKKYWSMP